MCAGGVHGVLAVAVVLRSDALCLRSPLHPPIPLPQPRSCPLCPGTGPSRRPAARSPPARPGLTASSPCCCPSCFKIKSDSLAQHRGRGDLRVRTQPRVICVLHAVLAHFSPHPPHAHAHTHQVTHSFHTCALGTYCSPCRGGLSLF